MKRKDEFDESCQQGRAMRPRPKDVAYLECEVDDIPRVPRVPYEQLSLLLTQGNFAHLSAAVQPGDLTADLLRSTGFQDPILIHPCASIAITHEELGMRAPEGLDAAAIAEKAGPDLLVPTINVETQESGLRMTLRQWADYFAQPPGSCPAGRICRYPLLNVVSLSLAGTPLQEEVQAPAAVRAVDLVDGVWPATEKPRPEVLLYALMSPAGAYTDFHVDFGGSSVWYHVISGRKSFLLVPPTPPNLAAFESWASSEKQAGRFFGHEVEGALLAELGPGDTMLIPGSWPHAVATLEDSVVVGGNFLHALDLRRAVETWDMETRLGVAPAARFPLFRQLMWHTAAHYHRLLCSGPAGDDAPMTNGAGHCAKQPAVSAWEVSGLAAVLAFLRRSLRAVARFGTSVCPPSIADPAGMLQELDAVTGQMLPRELNLQVPDDYMDFDSLDTGFLGDRGKGYGQEYDVMPEGLLLEEGEGLLSTGAVQTGVHHHDYHTLDWESAPQQQQSQRQKGAQSDPQTTSEEDAESEEERLAELEDSEADWSGASDEDKQPKKAHRTARQIRPGAPKLLGRPREGSQPRLKRLVKRRTGSDASGVDIPVRRAAPNGALLSKLGRSRASMEDTLQQQRAAYASLDQEDGPSDAQQRFTTPRRGLHADAALMRSPEEQSQRKAEEAVCTLRSRLQRELALQGRVTSGHVKLKDGGERLRASLAAAATQLAAGLHALEAAGVLEPPWRPSAFQGATLRFINGEGRIQGPFTLDHLKLLAEDSIIRSDTVVLHSAHGSALLSSVLAMPAPSEPPCSAQQLTGPSADTGCYRDQGRSGAGWGSSGRANGSRWHKESRQSRGRSLHTQHQNRRSRSRSASPDNEAAERDRLAAAEAARARRAEEAAARAEAARSRDARRLAEAAAAWKRLRQSSASQAMQSLRQQVLAEALETEAALEGSWVFLGSDGTEEGPFTRSELLSMYRSGQLSATTMVHDEEEGTSVRLTALLPATVTATQPKKRNASAAPTAYPSMSTLTAHPQSEVASSTARTSTDMPSSSSPADAPNSQEVDMDVEVFDEPVSPALCMEPLSDAEEGDGRIASSTGLQSSPREQEQPERPAGELQHANSKEASAAGGPWGDDPPPPPPDSPPPPPPLPEDSTGIDGGAELEAAERDLRNTNGRGKVCTAAAPLGRPPPLPEDSSKVGVGSGLLSALLPVEGRTASYLAEGTKLACIEPLDQSRYVASHGDTDTVQLAGQHLLSPAEQQSCVPPWTHAPHSSAQGRTEMQGHHSPPYLQQSQPDHKRQSEQQRQPVGSVQEQALQQQPWRQQQAHVHLPQQQQSIGSGSNGVLADTGGLGNMLQSIMENVRSAGAAVRQMGGPAPPLGQLGAPSGQAALSPHLQHNVAHSMPSYSAQAQGAMQPGPHIYGTGNSQELLGWRQQPSHMQPAQPQAPFEHSWQLQQSPAGQQDPSPMSSQHQSGLGSQPHMGQQAAPLYHAAGMSLTAHQGQHATPRHGTAEAHPCPTTLQSFLPEHQPSSGFHTAHAVPGSSLQEWMPLQHPAITNGAQPALPVHQSWQPVQGLLTHQPVQSPVVYPWG